MLVRVGQAARIKLPAITSSVSESLPSSLDTRSSRIIRFFNATSSADAE